jgi:transcriptional regulator with XRE-family HTH domain
MNLNRDALVALRERSGLSKQELADRAGVDRTLITRLENGERRATPAVMKKLAAALAVSLLAISGPEEVAV